MSQNRQNIQLLVKQLNEQIIGQHQVVQSLIITLLCNGHLLLEGLPGTAKTRAIKMLADSLEASLGRIQFTPDLLPSDVTGTEMLKDGSAQSRLRFEPGPIFNQLVLADEINRAPAKVQSALLEAMAERQLSVAGKTYALPELFMVMATQNPVEQEGTYPLPEAQMDRFLLKVEVDYPELSSEMAIVKMVRNEESQSPARLETFSAQMILSARQEVQQVHVSDAMLEYLVSLVMATRQPHFFNDSALPTWLKEGASPRASIALDKAARAHAWLAGRNHVEPQDVQAIAYSVLGHRITLSYDAIADRVSAKEVVEELLCQVAVM